MYTFNFFTVFMILISSFFTYGNEVTIGGPRYDIEKYKDWIGSKHCTEIDDYRNTNRVILQILVICKALHYGGSKSEIVLTDFPNYSRSLLEAKKGTITLPSDSIWTNISLNNDFYISKPFFKKKEFQKGFYALPSVRDDIEKHIAQNKLINISALQTIRNYTLLSSQNWTYDWHALKRLNIPAIDTPIKSSMCKMLKHRRVDLFLGEILMNSENNLQINCENVILKPVRGIKIIFDTPRHFVVSKRAPNGKDIFKALEKGLQILEDTGDLEKARYPNKSNKKLIESWENLLPFSPAQISPQFYTKGL